MSDKTDELLATLAENTRVNRLLIEANTQLTDSAKAVTIKIDESIAVGRELTTIINDMLVCFEAAPYDDDELDAGFTFPVKLIG